MASAISVASSFFAPAAHGEFVRWRTGESKRSFLRVKSKPFDFDELQQALAVLNKKASVLAEA
jgi:hypothetical protein